MRRRMNNTALNALAGMARIAMLLLMLGAWTQAAQASMRPDCPMASTASSAPCASASGCAVGRPACMQATMNAATPRLMRTQRVLSREQLPSGMVPGWFVLPARMAALDQPPKAINAVVRPIRSRRRNASLAVLHCSFQR